MRRGNAFGRVSLPVCVHVCAVCALTFESLDPESSFLVCGISSEYLSEIRVLRSSGQGQGHRSMNGAYERY